MNNFKVGDIVKLNVADPSWEAGREYGKIINVINDKYLEIKWDKNKCLSSFRCVNYNKETWFSINVKLVKLIDDNKICKKIK